MSPKTCLKELKETFKFCAEKRQKNEGMEAGGCGGKGRGLSRYGRLTGQIERKFFLKKT